MTRLTESIEIEYPESDGQPMAETDLHRDWMIRIIDRLLYRYRNDPNTYVSGDLLVYWVEGDPRRSVAPDAFVAKGCPMHRRRTFKVWEEPAPPTVAIEVTSLSTKRNDEVEKPRKFAEIGIAEYFLFDPTRDYLNPPLRGYRLDGEEYVPIEPDARGRLACQELGIELWLDDDDLVLFDAVTGAPLPTEAEAERDAREAAEAEIARLRRLLDERSPDDGVDS